MAKERVQKLLAAAGIGSRRACEALIEAGRVKVNGQVVHLGDKADPEKDTIVLDGKVIRLPKQKIYLLKSAEQELAWIRWQQNESIH